MVTPWVRHTPERALNRKLRKAGFAARGLDDAGIDQVAYDDSDGFISEDTVEMLAVAHREKNWRKLAAVLVTERRWTVVEGGWLIHDYEQFNMTKAYWEAEKAKKQAAGRRGGQARAQADASANAPPSATANGTASASPGAAAPAVADVQANAQAASLRFVKSKSSSSSVLEAPSATDAEEEDPQLRKKIHAVAYQIAQQRLDRRPDDLNNVGDRTSWLTKVSADIAENEIKPRAAEFDFTAPVVTLVAQFQRRKQQPKPATPTPQPCPNPDCHNGNIELEDGTIGRCPTCIPTRAG